MIPAASASSPPSRGLLPGQFRCVALQGIGDGGNAYPHGMAWFGDHLYVASTRMVLQLLYYVSHRVNAWNPYPVRVREGNPYGYLDARSQIWRYHPPTNRWEQVLRSDLTEPKDGIRYPFFNGVRNMVPYRAPGATRTSLYMPTVAPTNGPDPMLLRTEDGLHFERLPLAGTGAARFKTFRPMVDFKGRLWIAPTGKSGSGSSAGAALVMTSTDPERYPWEQCNEDNFGNPRNEGVFEMIEYAGHLYAGTVNPDGFELWKTDGENPPHCRWTRVLTRGADRGPNNEAVGSMMVFRGALYLGVSIINGGYDRRHGIGPAPAEILRVHPDDSWDLVMGEGRLTDQGLKLPLSGLGAGFDNPFNTYVWRMGIHDGWLYAGTFSSAGVVRYFNPENFSERVRRIMDRDRLELLAEKIGGAALWRTRDGETWLPVTINGFGNPFNYGIRGIVSTPHGLFIGTANPFGPEVAVHRTSGWTYEPNPRGGLEIWMGSHEHQPDTRDLAHPPVPPAVLSTLPPLDADGLNREERLDLHLRHLLDEFFQHPHARWFGFWKRGVHLMAQARETLLHELLDLADPPPGTGSRVLDLADSTTFASTWLNLHTPGLTIETLALSSRLTEPATMGPHLSLRRRAFPLPDSTCDRILDVETSSRTPHPASWLAEAHRCLKPGGQLIGSAILRESTHPTPESWSNALKAAGFTGIRIADATRESWQGFSSKCSMFLWEKNITGELDREGMETLKDMAYGFLSPITGYLLYRARKSD